MISRLYYECHITIEPVFGERLALFTDIAGLHDFRVAKLLMQKTLDPSQKDSFCTGRSRDLVELTARMRGLISDLKRGRFQVWRYKIEDTIIDSKIDDELGLVA